jgi:hypothetical protein
MNTPDLTIDDYDAACKRITEIERHYRDACKVMAKQRERIAELEADLAARREVEAVLELAIVVACNSRGLPGTASKMVGFGEP